MSYPERDRAGRGRYNPGFGAKLMSDLTGERVRIVVQAFDYSRYRPTPGDLWTWSAQALRAGATDLSFFASDNPRFTNRRLYDAMLAIARAVRGTRLPAPPSTPSSSCSTPPPSEGQAQPARTGGVRYRTSGDALYTTYSLLGELAGGAFSFDADTRLAAEPARLAAARTIWMPRGDTLDAHLRRPAGGVGAGGRHAHRHRPGRLHPHALGRAARRRSATCWWARRSGRCAAARCSRCPRARSTAPPRTTC